MPQRREKYTNSLQNTFPPTGMVFQELSEVTTNNTIKVYSPKNYLII